MTALSLRFSQALARGRRESRSPDTREALLASLLRKRATAYVAGAEELEALLRDQIRWALPIDSDPKASDDAQPSGGLPD